LPSCPVGMTVGAHLIAHRVSSTEGQSHDAVSADFSLLRQPHLSGNSVVRLYRPLLLLTLQHCRRK